jgi:FkbM family methyltransferase
MLTQHWPVDPGRAPAIIDVTDLDADLGGLEVLRQTITRPPALDHPDRGAVLVVLTGPNSPAHTSLDDLAEVLASIRPGTCAIVLLGWPAGKLPEDGLLSAFDLAGCGISEVVNVDQTPILGVDFALVVDRADAREGGESGASLRTANEYMLGQVEAMALRRDVAELTKSVEGLNRKLATSERRLAALESSAALQIGRAILAGARRPGRAAVTVPRELARIYREHTANRSRRVQTHPTVPVALPRVGRDAGRPEIITIKAPGDFLVPKRLAAGGLAGFESTALACFLAACDVAGPGAVFDIGANVGIYAALAAAMTDRPVYAFEPWQELVDVARQLADDNNLRFTVESLALGAKNEVATFYLSDKSDSSNSLAAGFRQSSNNFDVVVETVDSYVARTGAVPAVIKVDTETTEPDVIGGATKTIMEHRPWILCEVLAGRVETQLEAVLAPLRYRWYHVTDGVRFREAARIEGDRTYENLMWLFAPVKPGEEFWTALHERSAALSSCTAERARTLLAGH